MTSPRDTVRIAAIADILLHYPVTAIFHGHAHHGQLEGRTTTEIPIFNVSLPLLRDRVPERPFRLLEVAGPADAIVQISLSST